MFYLNSLNIAWDFSIKDSELLLAAKLKEENLCKAISVFNVGTLESGLTSNTFFGKAVTEKIRFISCSKKKSFLSISRISLSPDCTQIIRAAMANFIQSIDARILYEVLLKCGENNIAVTTNHDCYSVSPLFYEKVQTFYFESYCKIVLGDNYIYNFFKNNIIYSTLDIETQLNEYKQNRIKILDKIKDFKIKMSPFILKS